jgi:hypothetical protein
VNKKTASYAIVIALIFSIISSGFAQAQGLPSTVLCTVTPAQVRIGETVSVAGSINPVQQDISVNLVYEQPDNKLIQTTVRTALDGTFKDSFQPLHEGVWKVNASWGGNADYNGSWADSYFTVFSPSSIVVSTTNDHIIAGLDNDVTIAIKNNGSAPISAVVAVLQLPSPLVVRGNSYQWEFTQLGIGSSISIPLQIFAPVSVTGLTFPGQLQLTYRDTYGLNYNETYPVNFIIVGLIQPVVYEQNVSPQPSNPGMKVTITAEILNKGNAPARYTNASVVASSVIELLDESVNYIGDVEPNSPVQFGASFKIRSDVLILNGTYPVTVVISFEDDQYAEHSLNFTVDVVVQSSQGSQGNGSVQPTLLDSLKEISIPLIIIIAASVVSVLFYRRRITARSKLTGNESKRK